MTTEWSTVTIQALQNAWAGAIEFLPKLVVGLIVFAIGWLISVAVGKLVARLLRVANFDKLFIKSGWKTALESADVKVNPSEFIGAIIKWVLVIVSLQIFVGIMGLVEFAVFLTDVLNWLPNLVIAAAIFVVSIIVADILEKVIKTAVRGLEIKCSAMLGAIVRTAIYTFAILMILLQLGVTPSIIDTIVTGFVGMFALAFGLAFGLGGREMASEILRALKSKITEK